MRQLFRQNRVLCWRTAPRLDVPYRAIGAQNATCNLHSFFFANENRHSSQQLRVSRGGGSTCLNLLRLDQKRRNAGY